MKRIPSTLRDLRILPLLAICSCSFGLTHAQTTATWDGGVGSQAWGQAGNWVTTTPTFDNTLEVIFFADSTPDFNSSLGSSRVIRALTYNDNADDSDIRLGIRRDSAGGSTASLTMGGNATLAPFISVTSGASGNITIGDDGNTTYAFGNLILAADLTVTHNGSGTLTINRPITGVGRSITKSGTGTLVFSGDNTYSGATHINAGTLRITSGNINSTSAVNVAAGGTFRYNSSTALTVAPTLNGDGISNRAVLGGTGPINASVTFNNLGDVLSPGNSPGTQTYIPAQDWSSFSYDWEINDFTGTSPGTHFDQLILSSTLNLSGGSGSYILNVLGLTAGNVAGDTPNFSEIDRTWTILTSTGIIGFNAANWTINTSGFSSPDEGLWNISQSGNNLVLSYTVIPEPSAALLSGLGILALLRRRR